MSSSFRRKRQEASSSSIAGLKGTKAWTGGITLTSAGLRDFDAILGGGQPLGTCLLIEEDRWTRDLAQCLIKYWCAEAVSHEQTLLVPYFEKDARDIDISIPPYYDEEEPLLPSSLLVSKSLITDLLDNLPRNLHWDKNAGHLEQLALARAMPLEILEEEDAEEGLDIAWQYRTSVQEERLGIVTTAQTRKTEDTFCHSFDLSGLMKDQREACLDTTLMYKISCCDERCQNFRSCGRKVFRELVLRVKEKLAKYKGNVLRLLLYQVDPNVLSVALALLIAHIRQHELPVVVLVSIKPWTCCSKGTTSLRRICDVVVQTEGFASRVAFPPPPEFRHLHGLLHVVKVSTVTSATANGSGHFADMTLNKRVAAHVYGLKRDRRKLHIPLLHIPPEAYAAGGSVSSGAVRSGAGIPKGTSSGCASGGNTLLDF